MDLDNVYKDDLKGRTLVIVKTLAFTLILFGGHMLAAYAYKYGIVASDNSTPYGVLVALQAAGYFWLALEERKVADPNDAGKYILLLGSIVIVAFLAFALSHYDAMRENGFIPPTWLQWLDEPANLAMSALVATGIMTALGVLAMAVIELIIGCAQAIRRRMRSGA